MIEGKNVNYNNLVREALKNNTGFNQLPDTDQIHMVKSFGNIFSSLYQKNRTWSTFRWDEVNSRMHI